jgi:hypothetical protein
LFSLFLFWFFIVFGRVLAAASVSGARSRAGSRARSRRKEKRTAVAIEAQLRMPVKTIQQPPIIDKLPLFLTHPR